MSKLHLLISNDAGHDLKQIWSYIARQSGADRASTVVNRIMNEIDCLTEYPGLGHTRLDLPATYRAWSVLKYLIIYRHDSVALSILRIVHGARDIRRLMDQ